MIRFRVTSVTRRSSSEVDTVHYTYENDNRKGTRVKGAEWEEVEFTAEIEEQPTIQIANVAGKCILIGNPKLLINDPDLFGTYKINDIVEFMPTPVKPESSAN